MYTEVKEKTTDALYTMLLKPVEVLQGVPMQPLGRGT